ncbi:glycosyltransferase family 9 protein [Sebaldella termitidis]|uniref:glycosyltransferase family 9 protein n=1 Tax=Sebaldella termitidis TaxID=826 RepID=UPI003EB9A115
MKKPYWLKQSYLKYKINNILFSFTQIFISKNKNGKRVLITELDGIGDIIVKQKLVDLIAEKHGKENVVLLATYGTELLEFMGYKCEVFTKNVHYNFFKLINLFKKLCEYDIGILYSLEFSSEDKLDFLNKLRLKEIYAFKGGIIDNWKGKNVNLVEKEGTKVLDILSNYARKFINPNVKKNQIIPRLNVETFDGSYIAVGIGSSDKNKIAFPKKLAEFLETITKEYPEMKFHILGYGKNDLEYFKKIESCFSKKENLVCFVNKLDLVGTMHQIAHAKLYIGFDSGLYNIAYALKKKQICMVSINRGHDFFHEDENIRFVYKELDSRAETITDSLGYNSEISSISTSIFKENFDFLFEESRKINTFIN